MKYLYHLTRPEYLDRILSEGLKPIVGDNSKLVGDMVPTSHMSERKYLPYWNLLLDRPGVLLKIDTSYLCEDRIQERNYHLYKEKIYDELIPKKAVSVANGINLSLGNLDVNSRQEFKLSIVRSVSKICELIARLASDPEVELIRSVMWIMLILMVMRVCMNIFIENLMLQKILNGCTAGWCLIIPVF